MTLTQNLFKLPISEPEVNKIDYKESPEEGGWWAFLSEIPTTKAFGKGKQDAFRNLIVLLSRIRE